MNNIKKAFKQKSALRCMADGGPVRPTPEMLGSGMARHAGDVLARRPAQIESALDEALGDAPARPAARPAPAPAPTPAPAKKPEEGKSILRSFFGLADGGMAPPHAPLKHGGEVKGKGGPTDDKVGPVALSNDEYVLPADTTKAIGKDVLDAIRLATHKFVDPDEENELRGMANGGTFYVDPQGVATDTLPPNRLPVPATPAASNVIEGTATRVAGSAAGSAAPTAASSLRTAVSTGGGRLGAAARGALPLAVMSGAADSYNDASSGYRKQFADSVGGGDSVAGSIGADALRTLGNIGNTLTLGTGERIGRGISNLTSGGSFIDGVMQTPDRTAFNEREMGRVMAPGAPTANAVPSTTPADTTIRGMDTSAGALRLGKDPGNGFAQEDRFSGNGYRVYGRDNPNAGKPGESARQYIGVGTPGPQEDPIMGEIRSALRSFGQNSGGGGGYSPSTANARDINARYDKLAQQLSGMYSSKGQGNLARHLVELEQARSAALGEDARNQSALRGQDMQASTAANGANLQARMQMLQTLGQLAGQRGQQGAQAQAAQLKALQDAQKMAQEGEEKGFERYTGAISSMFVGPDGKPDAAEQERFTSFLQASDPKAKEKFAAMAPQDQMTLLQNFKTLYDMNKARNDTATGGLLNSGAVTNRADMPADVRESTWNDVWNNHLPLTDYLYSNLPGTNPNVAVTESGQPVLMSKYATTDGNWDADKLDLIRRRTGKDQQGRSALRGN